MVLLRDEYNQMSQGYNTDDELRALRADLEEKDRQIKLLSQNHRSPRGDEIKQDIHTLRKDNDRLRQQIS